MNNEYAAIVNNQDQALCHLFFHCCLEDDRFTEPEMDKLSAMLVQLGIQPKLHIREELVSYRRYRTSIIDETEFLQFLLQQIRPVNELALYSWCIELCISEPSLDAREEALLNKLGGLLGISLAEMATINKLIAQRKAVELQKIF